MVSNEFAASMVAPIETTHLIDFSQDPLHKRNQALHAKSITGKQSKLK